MGAGSAGAGGIPGRLQAEGKGIPDTGGGEQGVHFPD